MKLHLQNRKIHKTYYRLRNSFIGFIFQTPNHCCIAAVVILSLRSIYAFLIHWLFRSYAFTADILEGVGNKHLLELGCHHVKNLRLSYNRAVRFYVCRWNQNKEFHIAKSNSARSYYLSTVAYTEITSGGSTDKNYLAGNCLEEEKSNL